MTSAKNLWHRMDGPVKIGLFFAVLGILLTIIGIFRDCEPRDPEKSFTVEEVLQQYFAHRSYPVVKQFPVGHIVENCTLPMGVMAELDADLCSLIILEDPAVAGSASPK